MSNKKYSKTYIKIYEIRLASNVQYNISENMSWQDFLCSNLCFKKTITNKSPIVVIWSYYTI